MYFLKKLLQNIRACCLNVTMLQCDVWENVWGLGSWCLISPHVGGRVEAALRNLLKSAVTVLWRILWALQVVLINHLLVNKSLNYKHM